MAKVCRECKEPVRWGAKVCLRCGEQNPSGANPGDVVLWSIAMFILSGLIYAASKQIGAALFH
jgi:hypothetical protein